MQRTVDVGFGYSKLNSTELEDKFNALDNNSKITLKTCKTLGKSALKPILKGFGFQEKDYDDICILIDGGSLGTNPADLLSSIDVEKLILQNNKPDILRSYNVIWPRTALKDPSPEIKDRRRVIIYACLEKPRGVPASIVNNTVTRYNGFTQKIANLKSLLQNNKAIAKFKDRYNAKFYDTNFHVKSKKKDGNKSKKFDAALYQIRDTTLNITNIQIDAKQLIGEVRNYVVNKLQIAKFKHNSIHPKTTTITQHNSANTITIEISPSLWKMYSKILTDVSGIEKECKVLMQNIDSVMIDMKQHKYVSGPKGKTVAERLDMEEKRRGDHLKREQTRNKNTKKTVKKKGKNTSIIKGKSKNKSKGNGKDKNDINKSKKNKRKSKNDLFVYGSALQGRNPILNYPVYHRALNYGYVRQTSTFTVPAWITFLMLCYLCDFSCYKCGLIQSKNKNIEVNICNGICIKFICSECVMSRDGKCVTFCCDKHKK